MYDQFLWRIRESLWNILQIGKQIGKLLDMPKRPQAQKHICWVWSLKNLETWFQILKSLKSLKNSTFPVTVMVLLKMGPMGPRGLGPNPFSTVSPCPLGVFFRQKRRLKKRSAYFKEHVYFLRFLLFWQMLT